jgi:hypothetical protein
MPRCCRRNLIESCDGLVPDRLIREIFYAMDLPIFKFGQKSKLIDMLRFRISSIIKLRKKPRSG